MTSLVVGGGALRICLITIWTRNAFPQKAITCLVQIAGLFPVWEMAWQVSLADWLIVDWYTHS